MTPARFGSVLPPGFLSRPPSFLPLPSQLHGTCLFRSIHFGVSVDPPEQFLSEDCSFIATRKARPVGQPILVVHQIRDLEGSLPAPFLRGIPVFALELNIQNHRAPN